eukprot:CAMPEP_0197498586 /NCGR_PEP_ID=MMETSP1311-20131121/58555_1 /TAXON_ID=464262 /ORGANISM="Genus nov. species nov., Strain RCC856" /LENGTH=56 /DNA_ID=CAMNT_0043044297 /DNA_START=133 /DNA_END=300 /DNA_ORIENTATION=+
MGRRTTEGANESAKVLSSEKRAPSFAKEVGGLKQQHGGLNGAHHGSNGGERERQDR